MRKNEGMIPVISDFEIEGYCGTRETEGIDVPALVLESLPLP